MPTAPLADLMLLAHECLKKAKEAAEKIQFSESLTKNLHRYSRAASTGRTLISEPEYEDIEDFHGMRAWGAVLSFDLRESTKRALKYGAKKTYITMHTFMRTMLAVLDEMDGIVVGLRGDGAIACFGLTTLATRESQTTREEQETAITVACDCGDAMVKTVRKVINPVLEAGGIDAGLRIGVGIDVGEVVVTNIGLGRARDMTAYGNPMNNACHKSFGNNEVILSKTAKLCFPTSKTGRTTFTKHLTKDDAYILEYPADHKTLV